MRKTDQFGHDAIHQALRELIEEYKRKHCNTVLSERRKWDIIRLRNIKGASAVKHIKVL